MLRYLWCKRFNGVGSIHIGHTYDGQPYDWRTQGVDTLHGANVHVHIYPWQSTFQLTVNVGVGIAQRSNV